MGERGARRRRVVVLARAQLAVLVGQRREAPAKVAARPANATRPGS